MSTLSLPSRDRIVQLADEVEGQIQGFPELVVVSAAWYKSVGTADPRLSAALASVDETCAAGVPFIAVVDPRSANGVAELFAKQGAIVLHINENEVGLALPYLIGALVIDQLVKWEVLPSTVLMVKAEGEKSLFGGTDIPQHYLDGCAGLDVVTGVRQPYTLQTMPSYQRATEGVLGLAIGRLLDISRDTPSGVICLSSEGRKLWYRLVEDGVIANDWTYLIYLPFFAKGGLSVGTLPISFDYYREVVEDENGNAELDEKRRSQLQLMFAAAQALTGKQGLDPQDDIVTMIQWVTSGLPGLRSLPDGYNESSSAI